MAISFEIEIRDRATGALRRVASSISTAEMRSTQEKVAYRAMREVISHTPKKWTGQTRKAWHVDSGSEGFTVRNRSKVMRFLEEGTQGARAKSGGWLYIPLNRRASFGWTAGMRFGRDYVLAKRVKGIKAKHIAEKVQVKVIRWLREDLVVFISSRLRNIQ